MSKKVASIGFYVGGESVEYISYSENRSLLDWDIVLFRPEERIGYYAKDNYRGKPCLDDDQSFRLKERLNHWRRELNDAVGLGKTIFIFLPSKEEVFVATGTESYSGTGRNRHITRHVEITSNYKSIPIDLSPINAGGRSMSPTPLGKGLLAGILNDFSKEFSYKVTLDSEIKGVTIVTKSGSKPLSVKLQNDKSGGAIITLPYIDFDDPAFFRNDDGRRYFSKRGKEFGNKLISCLVAIEKEMKSRSGSTPAPSWASQEKFQMGEERNIMGELLEAERKLEEAQIAKENLLEKLQEAGRFRTLLYENGTALERAIIDGLKLLGFAAEPYTDGKSEFDVVFQSIEGRLLGEAEGKDSKPINIEKLRQLSMNIQEDLEREEVTSPAKGILFGNGSRFSHPSDRHEQFTEKCVAAANANGTALITTTDLFLSIRYIVESDDEEYRKKCRIAMLGGVGITKLPEPPLTCAEASAVTTS